MRHPDEIFTIVLGPGSPLRRLLEVLELSDVCIYKGAPHWNLAADNPDVSGYPWMSSLP